MPSPLRHILERVASGAVSPADAEREVAKQHVGDLGDVAVDLARLARRGRPEAIFGEGKSPAQILAAAKSLLTAGQNLIVTRIALRDAKEVQAGIASISNITSYYHERPRVLTASAVPVPRKRGTVAIVCAGTTDLPIAEEALVVADALGSPVTLVRDVGVAGLHRLMRHADTLRSARVIVVAAGMDGALPAVVAGLTAAPVIALPTSVGYGASFSGIAPLLTMLNSCSPGVAVVNIDNGYGAGYLADVMNGLGESAAPPEPAAKEPAAMKTTRRRAQ